MILLTIRISEQDAKKFALTEGHSIDQFNLVEDGIYRVYKDMFGSTCIMFKSYRNDLESFLDSLHNTVKNLLNSTVDSTVSYDTKILADLFSKVMDDVELSLKDNDNMIRGTLDSPNGFINITTALVMNDISVIDVDASYACEERRYLNNFGLSDDKMEMCLGYSISIEVPVNSFIEDKSAHDGSSKSIGFTVSNKMIRYKTNDQLSKEIDLIKANIDSLFDGATSVCNRFNLLNLRESLKRKVANLIKDSIEAKEVKEKIAYKDPTTGVEVSAKIDCDSVLS